MNEDKMEPEEVDETASDEAEVAAEAGGPRAGFEPHPFRVTPFVFAAAFAAMGLAGITDFSTDDATGWLWVIALFVFGLAGATAAFARRADPV